MKKIELLAPAGNLFKLKIAILYGADAVYIGGKSFSLRARANNFTNDDIKEACLFAKEYHAKVYVTMNIIPHDEDFTGLEDYLTFLEKVGVYAIITSSVHIMETARNLTPKLEVHISTQLSVANSYSCHYYERLGAKRVVLAREVSLKQMKLIREKTKIGLEVFIHGGMCSSFSGRCMLSNYYVNRDANRGGCAHSCRWNYHLFGEDKKPICKDFFNFGAKDLMGIRFIPELITMGIDSLKIEGRMKSDYYIATIVKTYRQLIDDVYAGKEPDFKQYEKEIKKAENRATSRGFLRGQVTVKEQLYTRDDIPTKTFVGMVLEYNQETKEAIIEQRNYFQVGDELEFFGPHLVNTKYKVMQIRDIENNSLDAARHPKQKIILKIPFVVNKYDMIRLLQKSEK